jgi:hypothetical protein
MTAYGITSIRTLSVRPSTIRIDRSHVFVRAEELRIVRSFRQMRRDGPSRRQHNLSTPR